MKRKPVKKVLALMLTVMLLFTQMGGLSVSAEDVPAGAVAKIGSNYYTTLDSAVTAVNSGVGDTLTLLSDAAPTALPNVPCTITGAAKADGGFYGFTSGNLILLADTTFKNINLSLVSINSTDPSKILTVGTAVQFNDGYISASSHFIADVANIGYLYGNSTIDPGVTVKAKNVYWGNFTDTINGTLEITGGILGIENTILNGSGRVLLTKPVQYNDAVFSIAMTGATKAASTLTFEPAAGYTPAVGDRLVYMRDNSPASVSALANIRFSGALAGFTLKRSADFTGNAGNCELAKSPAAVGSIGYDTFANAVKAVNEGVGDAIILHDNITAAETDSFTKPVTVIGDGTMHTLTGSLSGSAGIKVSGVLTVTGSVTAAGDAEVTNGSVVQGNVTSTNGTAVIHQGGQVGGDLSAYGNITVNEGGKVAKGVVSNNGDVVLENCISEGAVQAKGTVKITNGSQITGTVIAEGDVQISNASSVSGSVTSKAGTVSVYNGGKVGTQDVPVPVKAGLDFALYGGGSVTGDVTVSGNAHVYDGGLVQGNFSVVNGKVTMGTDGRVLGSVHAADLDMATNAWIGSSAKAVDLVDVSGKLTITDSVVIATQTTAGTIEGSATDGHSSGIQGNLTADSIICKVGFMCNGNITGKTAASTMETWMQLGSLYKINNIGVLTQHSTGSGAVMSIPELENVAKIVTDGYINVAAGSTLAQTDLEMQQDSKLFLQGDTTVKSLSGAENTEILGAVPPAPDGSITPVKLTVTGAATGKLRLQANTVNITADSGSTAEVTDSIPDLAVAAKLDGNRKSWLPVCTSIQAVPHAEVGKWTKSPVIIDLQGITDSNKDYLDYAYSTDGGKTWSVCATPFSAQQDTPAAGTEYIFRIQDKCGNGLFNSAKCLVKIDNTAPSFTVENNPSGWTNQPAQLTVHAEETGAGLDSAPYSFDDGATWQSSNTFTAAANGDVKIKVKDALGNVGSATASVKKIDVTAPTASTSFAQTKNEAFRGVITVSPADEGGSQVAQVRVTGAAYDVAYDVTKTAAPYTFDVTYVGSYIVTVTDAAGNQTQMKQDVSFKTISSISISKEDGTPFTDGILVIDMSDTAYQKLKAVVSGSDGEVPADLYDLYWSSADNDVATVSASGEVTPIAVGQTSISVSAMDKTVSQYVYVTRSVPANQEPTPLLPSVLIPAGSIPAGLDIGQIQLVIAPLTPAQSDVAKGVVKGEDFPSDYVAYDILLLTTDGIVQPSGDITITVPYPQGSDADCFFKILHLEGGTQPKPVPKVVNTPNGIRFTVGSCSPFIIGWQKASANPDSGSQPVVSEPASSSQPDGSTVTSAPSANTGDQSSATNIIIIAVIALIFIICGILLGRKHRSI